MHATNAHRSADGRPTDVAGVAKELQTLATLLQAVSQGRESLLGAELLATLATTADLLTSTAMQLETRRRGLEGRAHSNTTGRSV